MTIHELTQSECLEVLAQTSVGRLACARHGQPYIVPISFYFDGNANLYSFSTLGRKIQWMRENPKVAVETDHIVDRFQWTSVVVTGVFEELDDSPGHSEDLRRAVELLQQRSHWWLPAAGNVVSGEAHSTTVVYRIRIASVSGRRAGPSPVLTK